MPVTKQAIKKVRQDRRKRVINLKVKVAQKRAILAFRKNPSKQALDTLYRAVDKAAKTNIIHKNRAARIKSRLSKVFSRKKPTVLGKPQKLDKSKG